MSSNLISTGIGSIAMGYANPGTSTIQSTGTGSFSIGSSSETSTILSGGTGSFACGGTIGQGSVESIGTGSLAVGSASSTYKISATNTGSVAMGNASTGTVQSTHSGAFVYGDNVSSTSNNSFVVGFSLPYLNIINLNPVQISALSLGTPVVKTGNFTLGQTENHIICNGGATITATLPTTNNSGRIITMRTVANFAVNSASSNISYNGTLSNTILLGMANKWAILACDGTNWIVIASNQMRINELTNVTVDDPSLYTGEVLSYNSSQQKWVNNNLVWNDLIGYIENSTTTPPNYTVFNTTQYAYSMRATGNTIFYFKYHTNHNWVVGQPFFFHVHLGTSSNTETGTAVFNATATYAPIGSAFTTSVNLANLTKTFVAGDQNKHYIIEIPLGTAGGSATTLDSNLIDIDSIIMIRLTYNDTTSTLITNTACFVFQADIHYLTYGAVGSANRTAPFNA